MAAVAGGPSSNALAVSRREPGWQASAGSSSVPRCIVAGFAPSSHHSQLTPLQQQGVDPAATPSQHWATDAGQAQGEQLQQQQQQQQRSGRRPTILSTAGFTNGHSSRAGCRDGETAATSGHHPPAHGARPGMLRSALGGAAGLSANPRAVAPTRNSCGQLSMQAAGSSRALPHPTQALSSPSGSSTLAPPGTSLAESEGCSTLGSPPQLPIAQAQQVSTAGTEAQNTLLLQTSLTRRQSWLLLGMVECPLAFIPGTPLCSFLLFTKPGLLPSLCSRNSHSHHSHPRASLHLSLPSLRTHC